MSDEENAALVIKTGIEQLFVPLQQMLDRLLGPAATEVGLGFGDSAKVWRLKRQLRLFQEVKRLLDQSGKDIKPIATRLFFPVLEAASIEDDDEMQTRWAALLANESTNIGSVHPSFIELLRQLAPVDARLLDKLYDHCIARHTRTVKPWVEPVSVAERERRLAAGENPEEAFDNLVRLGLVVSNYELLAKKREFILPDRKTRAIGSTPRLKEDYILSDVAVRFVKACRVPQKEQESTVKG